MPAALTAEALALGEVLLVALVLGAGLPALFALGVRALARGSETEATADGVTVRAPAARPIGRVVAYACFAVVVVVVLLGIAVIVAGGFGMALSFENVYPTFVAEP